MPRLKKGAITSRNLPTSSHDAQVTPEQQGRIEARRARLSKRSSATALNEQPAVGSQGTAADSASSSVPGSCSPGLFGVFNFSHLIINEVTASEVNICHVKTTSIC